MKRLYSIVLMLLFVSCHPVPVGASEEYVTIAQRIETEYSLPEGLLESICYVESNWKGKRGKHGEIGVCQIKPSTVDMICPGCKHVQENLSWGSQSNAVIEVQDVLKIAGYYEGNIDGIFGKLTHKAVVTFQAEHDLKQDGIVGKNTWKTLFGTAEPFATIVVQLEDPATNIRYAGLFLLWLQEYLETSDPAILSAAYNGGPRHPVVQYMLRVQKLVQREQNYFDAYEDFYYEDGKLL